CFFFSSRRRHTRFSRDWSSVCSSDLHQVSNLKHLVKHVLLYGLRNLKHRHDPPLWLLVYVLLFPASHALSLLFLCALGLVFAVQIGRASCRDGLLFSLVTELFGRYVR